MPEASTSAPGSVQPADSTLHLDFSGALSAITPLQGIDVSNNQGWINWQQVKNSKKAFALIKASEGTTFADGWFVRNFHVSKQRGLLRGAYHFADLYDPHEEAAHFAAMAGPLLQRGDWAMLDLEKPGYNIPDWALAWLQTAEQLLSVKPVLYSYLSYIQAFLQDERLASYPLIVADYAKEAPAVPAPWQVMTGWQSTDNAHVWGISGTVDLDTLYVDHAGWMKLAKQ